MRANIKLTHTARIQRDGTARRLERPMAPVQHGGTSNITYVASMEP
jgi:hypothetical protein